MTSTQTITRRLFLAMVALLPLHTVYLRAVVAWKPWLILVLTLTAMWVVLGGQNAAMRRPAVGAVVFLAAVLASWRPDAPVTFWRLFLALVAGVLLMLAVRRWGDQPLLPVVFWSGAAMAATGLVLGMVTSGVFGAEAVEAVNGIPYVERVNKTAYLSDGFVALTNWHQDPGYSALWTNLWLGLVVVGWSRGAIGAPAWLPPLVVGGLGAASVLTLSRSGWLGLVVACAASMVAAARLERPALRRAVTLLIRGLAAGALILVAHIAVDPEGVGADLTEAFRFRARTLLVIGAIDLGEPGVIDPGLVVPDNRVDVWTEYLDRFTSTPLRGIGLGTGWAEAGLQEPHNLAIQLLAETGLIGLAGFMVLLASLGRRVGPVAGTALAVVGIAGLTQTVLFEPALWFALGLWARHAGRISVEETVPIVSDLGKPE